MSYILDALRKADAQRERDASRGIHAQTTSLGTQAAESDPAGRIGCFALVAVAAVVAASVGWWFMRGDAGPELQSQPQPQPQPPVAAATQAPAPVVQHAQVASAISPPAPAPVSVPAAPTPAPVQAREAAFTARGSAAAPAPAAGPAPALTPTAPVPVAPLATAQASAPAATAPVAQGLPADAPRVAISGGVYSPNPAQRMLIVNGQVFNEGSEVAPGVKVEAIQPRTAILSFRGARYAVAY